MKQNINTYYIVLFTGLDIDFGGNKFLFRDESWYESRNRRMYQNFLQRKEIANKKTLPIAPLR